VAEQVGRGREVEQDHTWQRQRHDVVGPLSFWHEFNDTWHSCHLFDGASSDRMGLMPNVHAAPLTEVLFFDGFDDLDAVAPFEILTAAGFPVRAVRPPGASPQVTSAHGLRVSTEGELGEPALIVVPGGGWRDPSPHGVRALAAGPLPEQLAQRHAGGTVLASVCTGAMLLAASGVLTGRPAVTHRIALDDLAQAGAHVRAQARVVDDGSVVTCGGPAAGIDLTLHLVERFLGPFAAEQAAERIEHQRIGAVVTGRVAA
jgi:transcriptional regulator GlxA family with amidase domain